MGADSSTKGRTFGLLRAAMKLSMGPPLLVLPRQPRSHVDRPDLGVARHVGKQDAAVESPAGQDGDLVHVYFSLLCVLLG